MKSIWENAHNPKRIIIISDTSYVSPADKAVCFWQAAGLGSNVQTIVLLYVICKTLKSHEKCSR